jgi:glucose uptake protein
MPLGGGLIWAVSGLCAFTAASRLGMARAFGIWAPLNILVSLACGRWLFGEFADLKAGKLAMLGTAIVVILAGVLMIILSKGVAERAENRRAGFIGLMAALGAGILWGVYFIPIKLAGVSLWVAAFPMALGIFAGSALLAALARASLRLRSRPDYLRLTATGVLWTTGNYGMLLLVGELGAGRGYTIAQLSVVVNAIVGIYALKEPVPGTRAARLTLAGCVLATIGGILLGRLNP